MFFRIFLSLVVCVCVYFALLVFNLLVMLLKSFARVPLNVQILFFNLFSLHFEEKGYCPYDKKIRDLENRQCISS